MASGVKDFSLVVIVWFDLNVSQKQKRWEKGNEGILIVIVKPVPICFFFIISMKKLQWTNNKLLNEPFECFVITFTFERNKISLKYIKHAQSKQSHLHSHKSALYLNTQTILSNLTPQEYLQITFNMCQYKKSLSRVGNVSNAKTSASQIVCLVCLL